MATVTIDAVTKRFADGLEAVSDVSLRIDDGQLLVLVGPSGCGKTTLLRMVAGLEEPTGGEIRIGDRVVNGLSPRERDVSMVFQNYALYPHMSVADNIGFPLRMRKMSKEERERRVRDAARTLGLEEHLERRPAQLSGGQRQRVAMGRAIVREPAVFLMDEPLSNLDAKLRIQMRAEIMRVQRRIGVSTLYVTHDQTEAMTMGDMVAVLRKGRVQQHDRPQVLYDRPANLFVAAFIGSPAMNLYRAGVGGDGTTLQVGGQQLELGGHLRPGVRPGQDVVVGIRPEDLSEPSPGSEAAAGRRLIGRVDLVEHLGSEMLVHFGLDAETFAVEAEGEAEADEPLAATVGAVAGGTHRGQGVAKVGPRAAAAPGDAMTFAVDPGRVHLFDPVTGERIGSPGATPGTQTS